MPKTASNNFATAMAAEERWVVELCRWSLGGVWAALLCTCNYESPLVVDVGIGEGPLDWYPLAMMRDEIQSQATLEVDEVALRVPNATVTVPAIGDYSLAELALNGAFDRGELRIYQYDMLGGNTFHHSSWRIEGVTGTDRTTVGLRLRGWSAAMLRDIPRTIIQAQCNNALFGSYCGLSQVAYEVAGTATGGTKLAVYAPLKKKPSGWFAGGLVVFSSGANLGTERLIQNSQPGLLTLFAPLRHPVLALDTFTAIPGCAKTPEACRDKFANYDESGDLRFRGFPYCPPPESLL